MTPDPKIAKPKLLLVDDDEDIRSQMKWALAPEYEVILAEDGPSACNAFKQNRPLITLLDLGLPPRPNDPEEGLAALSALLAIDRLAKIIVITGQAEKQNALRAIGQGAYDLLCKPVEMEDLKILLKRASHVALLEREYCKMQRRLDADAFEGMIGSSPQIQEVFATVRKVATSDAPVLILGESGTGKEMAALAIHQRSARKEEAFVAINCGAIPEALLESELFGHEKGSFTGAHVQRQGRIEMASDGTLFLDEIGELPLLLQVKVLRFLQEQTIERVGGRSKIQIDTRVIAATNVDLKTAMTQGKFREDLFYRLAVVSLRLPALRERPRDILVLARAFLEKACAGSGKEARDFSSDAILALESYAWPGNVRELDNRVRRAVIMAEGRHITAADLELTDNDEILTLAEARDAAERKVLIKGLARHGGSVMLAARDLGVSRPLVYDLMEKLGIPRSKTKKNDLEPKEDEKE